MQTIKSLVESLFSAARKKKKKTEQQEHSVEIATLHCSQISGNILAANWLPVHLCYPGVICNLDVYTPKLLGDIEVDCQGEVKKAM